MSETYVHRQLEQHLKQLVTWFPIVSVTGPRQSGKSTLCKAVFSSFEYVNLENPATCAAAEEDPLGFLHAHPAPLVIDEAQRVPGLFPVLQVVSDEGQAPGQYVLSGSQNFLMSRRIGQSLAGRVGLAMLLPFSYAEAASASPGLGVDTHTQRGGYPRLTVTGMPTEVFYASYVETYVQRDVSGGLDVRNLAAFRTFLRLCAQRAGGILNVSRLARDAGVSYQTARSWLSILESSSIVRLLNAWASNGTKRLIKAPKLYFCDTGLLCYLLRIHGTEELLRSEHLGAVVENLVIVELCKAHLNKGEEPELYYYRDDSKREVNVIDMTCGPEGFAAEVKSGETYRDKISLQLSRVAEELGFDAKHRYVVYRGAESFSAKNTEVRNLADFIAGL